MRAPSSFALLVPTASPSAAVRSEGAPWATPRRAKGLAIVALVAFLAVGGYATGGDAHGRPAVGDVATRSVEVAANEGLVTETWAADESRNGTRPDAAH